MPSRPSSLGAEFEPTADAYDIDFVVPLTHRLRFTRDCFGDDFGVLRDLFEPSAGRSARVQVWLDQGLVEWDATLLARIEKRFELAGELELTSAIKPLPGGEALKNAANQVDHMLAAFDEDQLDRRSYVVAIGGGAFLDAVGYAAAIAHRGLRLVRLPTTTLAQADSGVGVKNAVNWFGKKNWKGTFATPWAVVNDLGLLDGLSNRDFRCGFSEAVKVALLKSPPLFEFMVEHSRSIARRDMQRAEQALRQSVLLHLQHITRGGDPFELMQARPLDFGHWSAHKLEALTNYELRHGEAVSIGVALDTAYSYLTQGLPLKLAEQTFATLQDLKLPIWDARLVDGDAREPVVLQGLEEFRQHLGGELTITLIRGVGQPINVHEIKSDLMCEAMRMLQHYSSSDVSRQTA